MESKVRILTNYSYNEFEKRFIENTNKWKYDYGFYGEINNYKFYMFYVGIFKVLPWRTYIYGEYTDDGIKMYFGKDFKLPYAIGAFVGVISVFFVGFNLNNINNIYYLGSFFITLLLWIGVLCFPWCLIYTRKAKKRLINKMMYICDNKNCVFTDDE